MCKREPLTAEQIREAIYAGFESCQNETLPKKELDFFTNWTEFREFEPGVEKRLRPGYPLNSLEHIDAAVI